MKEKSTVFTNPISEQRFLWSVCIIRIFFSHVKAILLGDNSKYTRLNKVYMLKGSLVNGSGPPRLILWIV